MSKREPKLLVGDILESAYKILDYTAEQSFDDFIKDSKTVDAVIRNFEIIGEAASRLPYLRNSKTVFMKSTGIAFVALETVLFMIILASTIR